MEIIKEWSVLLCSASVLSGIIIFLIPEGKLKKAANIVISLFFMTVIVSLFSDGKLLDIDINADSDINIEEYSVHLNDYLILQSKQTIESLIDNELQEICKNPYSVESQWMVSGGEVTLTGVSITVSPADASKISIIKTKIGSLSGIVPEVYTQ